MTEKYINDFDSKAAEWDRNPLHWDRSEAIVRDMVKMIPLNKEMTALEYGAGTGIASFLLKDYLNEITLMDNSSEMVKVVNEKIRTTNAGNLRALNFDLEHTDYTDGRFDLIFTQMVLHHVADIESIVSKFSRLLNPGGFLAIADLYEEDGSFHGEGFNGHKGFNPGNLSGIIKKNNFINISLNTCFVIERKISETEMKKFEVFLLVAKHI